LASPNSVSLFKYVAGDNLNGKALNTVKYAQIISILKRFHVNTLLLQIRIKKTNMTFSQIIQLIPRVVKYNLKVIFAGKFVWFLLAALVFFIFFMFVRVWNREEINEAFIYMLLIFPGAMLIFYPAVFGIQNDEDSRILEILFGIPDYRFKVWGVRLVMIYVTVFFVLAAFAALGAVLMYPVNPFGMAAQLMFPVLFYGNLAFMFSTITRSGNGTAVVMVIISILLMIFSDMDFIRRTFWNILLNPYETPRNMLPVIWENIMIKNRIFLFTGSMVWMMVGLLNLQKREKFV
jgi:hypothetical protein